MQRWLKCILTLAVFTAGLFLGHLGILPGKATARPAEANEQVEAPADDEAVSSDSLTWQQDGDDLTVASTDPAVQYLAVADLTETSAWPELGSEDASILYGRGKIVLPMGEVEAMTFYRLEPVGTVHNQVFRPCDDPIAECFPIRPPIDPPQPLLRRHLAMIGEELVGP
ncbi:MAG: hypothetical protein AAF657_24540 [Acidobacteriota bacterium]